MFATKKQLRTNILRREKKLEETRQLQSENPRDRLVLLLPLSCGAAFLLRWDEAVGWWSWRPQPGAAPEINVPIDSALASTLHLIDIQTLKCATIFSTGYLDLAYENANDGKLLMWPDIFRHNYFLEFEDGNGIPDDRKDLREDYGGHVSCDWPEEYDDGRDIVEACRMKLEVEFIHDEDNNKTSFLGATYYHNQEILRLVPDWVTTVDGKFALRDYLADAIEQTHEAGWKRVGGGYYDRNGLELADQAF
jgi:hypothetical protein